MDPVIKSFQTFCHVCYFRQCACSAPFALYLRPAQELLFGSFFSIIFFPNKSINQLQIYVNSVLNRQVKMIIEISKSFKFLLSLDWMVKVDIFFRIEIPKVRANGVTIRYHWKCIKDLRPWVLRTFVYRSCIFWNSSSYFISAMLIILNFIATFQ